MRCTPASRTPRPGANRSGRHRRLEAPWRWPRHRQALAAAAVFSGVVLGTTFPLGTLLHQRAQTRATTAAVTRLHRVDQRLAAEVKALSNPAVAKALAERELGSAPSLGGSLPPGMDPNAPALDPAAGGPLVAYGLAPQAPTTGAPTAARAKKGAGFLTRVLQTLEFWR
ncbi:hypothetical protein [Aciditerrimonas ferrireducens]|uniref:hypothetical protein n=1 Tax=Aciditerrimonas ferrireducens TaxID=667306 RepID=UPI0020048D1A|nr:hypothetical protein [Aciditerrimonas ferrireducens]MCK4176390.1 hypothetical protein [Aciditerrimonas ferrireducens]